MLADESWRDGWAAWIEMQTPSRGVLDEGFLSRKVEGIMARTIPVFSSVLVAAALLFGSAAASAQTASALCGGDKGSKDEAPKNPSALCGGDKGSKDEAPKNPSALCGGDKGSKDEHPKNPS
jgi:hypothetical protein